MSTGSRRGALVRRIGLAGAWTLAHAGRLAFALLFLLALTLWGLGTRGVPLTVDIAQRLLAGQLTVAKAQGGLFGPILLEGVVFESDSSRTEIDRIALDWTPGWLLRRAVQLDRLAVGRVVVQQKPTPETPPKPLSTTLPFDLVIRAASVEQLTIRPVEGEALQLDALRARASWRGEQLVLEGLALAEAQRGSLQTGPLQAHARIALAPDRITVERLDVAGPAQLRAEGVIGLLGVPSTLAVLVKDGRWPLSGEPQLRAPALQLTLKGVLSGAPLDAALTARAALRTALDEQDLGFDLDTALQLGATGARIDRLRLKSTDGAGSLSAQGSASWQPALTVDATMEVSRLDPGVLLPEWAGQLNGTVRATTEQVDAVPRVQFDALLKDSKLRGYPLRLEARGTASLQGETQALQVEQLTLVSGSTTITAAGALLPRLDARLTVEARDLKTLLPQLAGAVQLRATAQGEPAHPALQASGTLRGLRYGEIALATGALEVDYTPEADSRATVTATGLVAGSTRIASSSLTASGRAANHTVTVKAAVDQPRSSASLTLAGALDLATQRWQGSLQQSTFTPPYGPVWLQESAGALTLAANQQQLSATCWRAGTARLCLDATLAPPLTRLAYRIEQLDTGAFAALLPPDWRLQTVVNGDGEVALRGAEPETLRLQLQLAPGSIAVPGAPVLNLLPSQLSVLQVGGSWQGKAAVALDRGTVALDATLPVEGGPLLERPLSGRVQLAVPDLAWVNALVPQVQQLRGALAGDFTIAGSAGAPRLEGALNLRDGSVTIAAAGITLKDVTAEVRGSNSGPLALSARATSGGTLTVDGTADFASGTPVVQLKIAGTEVQVADIADARVWVSPDLSYAQNAEGMRLEGTVTVPRADITPRRLAANAIGASADQVLVGAEAPAEKNLPLSARVRLVLGEKVTFEGFGLRSRITGEVTAFDRPGSGGTRGRGELRLIDAAYKAYGQEIEVETGRVLFNGGPIAEPTVDLVAKRSPREDVTVSLHVRGTLDQPTFDLTSSPAMPREQQLGWLLFGQPIDAGTGGEFSGAAAALSLGIAGGDALASRIGKVIGLDQVSLAADTSSTAWQSSNRSLPGAAGTDQTRFTVGKYLSPKLFVSYGVGLFDNGNVLRLLYDLGRGFKLRSEAGLETGGDLLYSVER